MSAATASAGTPLALTPLRADSVPLHTISVLVRNQPGVLVRVSLVFARRGYNIESLVVSPDVINGDFSRMTITCRGEAATFEQISKQLTKLIDVVHAIDHTGQATVETEIALVKIKGTDPQGAPRCCRSPSTTRPRSSTSAASRWCCGSTARARRSTASSACCARSASGSWSARARS